MVAVELFEQLGYIQIVMGHRRIPFVSWTDTLMIAPVAPPHKGP